MVNNRPHVYESCWTNINSHDDDIFLLSPISDETLSLAIEDWQIWKRWSLAHKNGEVTIETHPCLPDERERHLVLEHELKKCLGLNEDTMFAATAVFRFNSDRGDLAEWTIVPYDPSKDFRAKYKWVYEDDDDKDPSPNG